MPSGVAVNGLVEMRRAIAKFAPDVKKELDKEARMMLKVMVSDARGFAKSGLVPSGWTEISGKKITAQTSMFGKSSRRKFPFYDVSEIKRGITYKTGESKTDSNGFRSFYRLQNQSAAGAIYEWAGRSNPEGLPWVGPKGDPNNRKVSHSRNPGAGKNFINILDGKDGYRQIHGKKDGRLILRAVEKDQGRFRRNIISGVERAMVRCQERMNITDTFGGSNG